MNNQKGMTLIELIIVVVIMGLMFVLSTTFLTTTTSHAKVKSAARDVATELQMARMKAIYRNREYQVKLTLTAGTTTEDKYIFQQCSVTGMGNSCSSATCGSGCSGSWGTDPERLNMAASAGADVEIPLAVNVKTTGGTEAGELTVQFNPIGTAGGTGTGLCFVNRDKTDDIIKLCVSATTGKVTQDSVPSCTTGGCS